MTGCTILLAEVFPSLLTLPHESVVMLAQSVDRSVFQLVHVASTIFQTFLKERVHLQEGSWQQDWHHVPHTWWIVQLYKYHVHWGIYVNHSKRITEMLNSSLWHLNWVLQLAIAIAFETLAYSGRYLVIRNKSFVFGHVSCGDIWGFV